MIISILLSNDKTVISLGYWDQILWPIYIRIDNLESKTQQGQIRSDILFLGFIFIVYEYLKDENNIKKICLETKIYYLALITML